MADANTTLDFDLLHTQITSQIAAAFPAYRTVEFYRDDEDEKIPTPAVLLEICEVEPDPSADAGTGQLAAFLRFEARIIMGQRDPAVKLEVRRAACALAAWLYGKHWGNGVYADECEVLACAPDEFDPRLDKWAVWRVEWHQRVMLGANAWDAAGCPIGEDLFSFAPDIGIPHQADYIPAISP